jgi:ATP-dependent DNA helicase RecG
MTEGRLRLDDPIGLVPGVTPSSARKLAAEGCTCVRDLLLHAPFRYEDRTAFSRIADLQDGAPALVSGVVVGHRLVRTRRRGFTILQATFDDGSATLPVVWFNRPYLARALVPGRRAVLFGTAVMEKRGILMKNPEHELFEPQEDGDPIHMGRIVGIYRKLDGLTAKWQRRAIAAALEALDGPLETIGEADAIRRALSDIHFPPAHGRGGEAERARRTLALEELSAFCARIEEKREARAACPVEPFDWTPATTRRILSLLPFELTAAQEKAMGEIAGDLKSGRPMARLLQGDVGSGKTAVALLAALLAAENGRQAALMAPTEILAEQHADTIGRWLGGTKYRLALLTGKTPPAARRELGAALERGEIDLLIGTHALVEKPVRFADLGLAVIDEQHRFGVEHRARLSRKGPRPHVLVLSATPIPRSLAWTLFGDLDVSRLDEKPAGRGSTRTFVRPVARREAVLRFLGEKIGAGERAFVVVPAIEESAIAVAAAQRTAEAVAGAIPAARVEVVHGRIPPDRRREAMRRFASGEVNVLVATTVVEVGIDVPEATVMIVENADRFGLSQLHQLRGRVGRGARPSYCILLASEDAGPDALARLAVLRRSSDGFEIAEKDLQMRGPGDLLGSRQSGLPPFRIADPIADVAILARARSEARARRSRGEAIESELFPRAEPAATTPRPRRPGGRGGPGRVIETSNP